jgi:hypothetical protein
MTLVFSLSPRAANRLECEEMLDHAVLTAVAEQMMAESQPVAAFSGNPATTVGQPSSAEVVIGGRSWRVGLTGARRLRTVRFEMGGREYQAIEQNPEKASHWAKLAREGHRVVQIRDLATQKYVAAVVDGKVREYL